MSMLLGVGKFMLENHEAILSLGRTIRRGIIRIIRKDKLVPGFRVGDEVVVLEGGHPGIVGLIGTVSNTVVPGHLAVTVIHNMQRPRYNVQIEAVKPEYLQRIIRKS